MSRTFVHTPFAVAYRDKWYPASGPRYDKDEDPTKGLTFAEKRMAWQIERDAINWHEAKKHSGKPRVIRETSRRMTRIERLNARAAIKHEDYDSLTPTLSKNKRTALYYCD